jgi:hypothetical protein
MSRHTQENIIIGVIILILAGVIYMSYGYGPRARLVPVPVAVFGLVLAVIQLVWQNLSSTEELHVDLLEVLTGRSEGASGAGGAAQPAAAMAPRVWPRELAALGMVLAFMGLVLLVGPVTSIFLFTGAYFVVSGQYPWLKAASYTTLFTLAVYLLFVGALDIQLYHGVLEPVVELLR